MLAQLESLIASLDVRQPQVMLEVLMVSLNESQTLDLGVELEKLFDLDGETTLKLTSLFGLGRGGPVGTGQGGAGFTGVVLTPGQFAAVVRALETVNKGRSLSTPRLLVGNNQSATFDSVVEEPFVTVNVADVLATTSFGGFETAGTRVTVRPRIARGEHLELEYTVSLSAFTGEASGPGIPPPRQQSRVNSVATIPDGHTVVVGGIETTSEGDGQTRIPILGSVPLLGELFKSRSKSRNRARFFVFIRADVMRGTDFEFLRFLTVRDALSAGVDDGWPSVEARVIR
jgi:general secretion pathway protein D